MHKGKLENSALSSQVSELERNISLGTSHHRDVSSGIDRLHEALLSLGDSITTNIGIVNDNTKCISNALHVVHEDTSDIRRVVNCISTTYPAPSASAPHETGPGRETTPYPWSGSVADRLKALPVFVGPYTHLHEPVGSKPTPHPPTTPSLLGLSGRTSTHSL